METELREVKAGLKDVRQRLRELEKQVNRYQAVGLINKADLEDIEDRLALLEGLPA